jgi:hypothetical protein
VEAGRRHWRYLAAAAIVFSVSGLDEEKGKTKTIANVGIVQG